MKKLLSAAAIAAFCMMGCTSSSYKISGTIPDSTSISEVYLVVVSSQVPVDTAKVVNGEFVFAGVQNEPAIARVFGKDGDKRISTSFILENAKISFELGSDDVSGSALSQAYISMSESLNAVDIALSEKYNALLEKAKSEEVDMQAEVTKLQDDAISQYKEILLTSIGKNKNIVGAAAFNTYSQLAGDSDVAEIAKSLSEEVKSIPMVAEILKSLEKQAATQAGCMFTDFTIENGGVNGEKVSFSDYIGKGKYVLVDFFASWCGPCKAEMPNIKALYEQYAGDKFDVLGIAVWDEVEKTKSCVAEEGIAWPVIYNAQKIPTDIYGIKGIPQIILFAPDGTIVARDLRGSAMKAKVEEVLSK